MGGESLATEYPGTREQQGGPSRVCVCGAIVDGSEGALCPWLRGSGPPRASSLSSLYAMLHVVVTLQHAHKKRTSPATKSRKKRSRKNPATKSRRKRTS